MMSPRIRLLIRRNRFGGNTPVTAIDVSSWTSREYHSSIVVRIDSVSRRSNFHTQQRQRTQQRLPIVTNLSALDSITSSIRSFSAADASEEDKKQQYTTPELAEDAAKHKAGLDNPDVPSWQNPLHHNNEEMKKTYPEDFKNTEEFQAAVVPLPPAEISSDGSVAAPEYIHEIADEIVHLTMLEMNELINKIADHYGFHEGMLSPDDDGSGGDGAGGADDDDDDSGAKAPAVEKTNFDIKLMEFDAAAKIKIIKEVRSLAGLGLKEAKEIVEGAPKTILKDIKKEQAEEIKQKLEELGAKIEIV